MSVNLVFKPGVIPEQIVNPIPRVRAQQHQGVALHEGRIHPSNRCLIRWRGGEITPVTGQIIVQTAKGIIVGAFTPVRPVGNIAGVKLYPAGFRFERFAFFDLLIPPGERLVIQFVTVDELPPGELFPGGNLDVALSVVFRHPLVTIPQVSLPISIPILIGGVVPKELLRVYAEFFSEFCIDPRPGSDLTGRFHNPWAVVYTFKPTVLAHRNILLLPHPILSREDDVRIFDSGRHSAVHGHDEFHPLHGLNLGI